MLSLQPYRSVLRRKLTHFAILTILPRIPTANFLKASDGVVLLEADLQTAKMGQKILFAQMDQLSNNKENLCTGLSGLA